MRLKAPSLAVAAACILGGTCVSGQTFESSLAAGAAAVRPTISAVRARAAAAGPSASVPCCEGVCRNAPVHDPIFGAGVVEEVFSDGMAKIAFADAGSQFVDVDTLDLHAGSRVEHHRFGAGTVKEVFVKGDGRSVSVVFDDGATEFFAHDWELGKGVRSYKGLSPKDRVHDSYWGAGEVVEVFTDGLAKVRFDQGTVTFVEIGPLAVAP